MRALILAAALVTIGCGGVDGEPIEGTISIGYGTDGPITPRVGAALATVDSTTLTGNITFSTVGVDDLTITANGTFDVIRCF